MNAKAWLSNNLFALQCGIGYKPQYYSHLESPQALGWLEIHAENFMGPGGPEHEKLRELHRLYAISCHGVGLSLGSQEGISKDHLTKLRHLINWLKPDIFSEHLAWSSHNGIFYNDLLPLPYTKKTLSLICRHIQQTQDYLGMKLYLENPSVYINFRENDFTEQEFLHKIVQQTGCGLLLDVNNLYVSCINRKMSPAEYLSDFPLEHVGEIHLAGHEQDINTKHETLLIDSHSCEISSPVWNLFDQAVYALDHHGVHFIVIVEWDNNLPQWRVLYDQAHQAAEHMYSVIPHNKKTAGA